MATNDNELFKALEARIAELSSVNESLTKSEERFRMMVTSVADYAIFMVDPMGFVTSWNEGARKFKGYEADEIIGQHFSRFYTSNDIAQKKPERELEEARKTGRSEDEGWRVRKDGTRFWANVVITRVLDKNGNLLGFSKVTRDLTERRNAEEELRRSEERFRFMVSAVKDYAIFMLDPEGLVTSWNEGAKRFKGYEAHEIIGKHFSTFYSKEDIDRKHPEFELKKALDEGRYEEEGWRIRKDGTRFWANVVITRVNDGKGNLLGFSKVTRDLTEKKQNAEQLRLAYENLEKRIQTRTKDLEEALKSRDEFLSIASHELKTPLTSLKLQLQLSQKRIEKEPDSSPLKSGLTKSLHIGVRQVNSLTNLVDDLLDVSRIQTGVLEIHKEFFNLTELAEEILYRFEEQLKQVECVSRTDYDRSIVGNWDKSRIEQVIVNLIQNATKYAPGTEITITTRREKGFGVIEVADKGPGIDSSMSDAIFDRFTRVTSARNIGGLGLGLFITKRIVDLHQGTIKVESAPGKGARFIVCLPL